MDYTKYGLEPDGITPHTLVRTTAKASIVVIFQNPASNAWVPCERCDPASNAWVHSSAFYVVANNHERIRSIGVDKPYGFVYL